MRMSAHHHQTLQQYREVSTTRPLTFIAPARPTGISVIGLDQVGIVAVACLAHLGFPMVGVDIRASRNTDLLDGNAPVHEARLERLLLDGVREGRIQATQNLITAVTETDLTVLMSTAEDAETGSGADVGAPAKLARTSRAIGQALALKQGYHVVVISGDVPPGSLRELVRPEIERASGKRLGADFGLCCMPRFGRDISTVARFFSRSRTVVGASDARACAVVAGIMQLIDADAIYTTIEAAEMAQRADQLWQVTRMAFDAELARLCQAVGVEAGEVADIFRSTVRIDAPSSELGPSILRARSANSRELRDMVEIGARRGIELPLIESLASSARSDAA